MFTGIITDIGRIQAAEQKGDLRLQIACAYDMTSIDLGASIACSGVCLTVVDKGDDWFAVDVSADPARHAAWIHEYVEQGWDEVYLHFVGQEQEAFIDTFGEHVLPQLDPTPPPPAVTDRRAVEREEASR
jgi:hypothetical protein